MTQQCRGYRPHPWRKGICTECFGHQSTHTDGAKKGHPSGPASLAELKPEGPTARKRSTSDSSAYERVRQVASHSKAQKSTESIKSVNNKKFMGRKSPTSRRSSVTTEDKAKKIVDIESGYETPVDASDFLVAEINGIEEDVERATILEGSALHLGGRGGAVFTSREVSPAPPEEPVTSEFNVPTEDARANVAWFGNVAAPGMSSSTPPSAETNQSDGEAMSPIASRPATVSASGGIGDSFHTTLAPVRLERSDVGQEESPLVLPHALRNSPGTAGRFEVAMESSSEHLFVLEQQKLPACLSSDSLSRSRPNSLLIDDDDVADDGDVDDEEDDSIKEMEMKTLNFSAMSDTRTSRSPGEQPVDSPPLCTDPVFAADRRISTSSANEDDDSQRPSLKRLIKKVINSKRLIGSGRLDKHGGKAGGQSSMLKYSSFDTDSSRSCSERSLSAHASHGKRGATPKQGIPAAARFTASSEERLTRRIDLKRGSRVPAINTPTDEVISPYTHRERSRPGSDSSASQEFNQRESVSGQRALTRKSRFEPQRSSPFVVPWDESPDTMDYQRTIDESLDSMPLGLAAIWFSTSEVLDRQLPKHISKAASDWSNLVLVGHDAGLFPVTEMAHFDHTCNGRTTAFSMEIDVAVSFKRARSSGITRDNIIRGSMLRHFNIMRTCSKLVQRLPIELECKMGMATSDSIKHACYLTHSLLNYVTGHTFVAHNLTGKSLKDMETRTVLLVLQLLYALEHAHSHGIVHRNIDLDKMFIGTANGLSGDQLLLGGFEYSLSAARDKKIKVEPSSHPPPEWFVYDVNDLMYLGCHLDHLPPEIIGLCDSSPQLDFNCVDTYAVGVFLQELLDVFADNHVSILHHVGKAMRAPAPSIRLSLLKACKILECWLWGPESNLNDMDGTPFCREALQQWMHEQQTALLSTVAVRSMIGDLAVADVLHCRFLSMAKTNHLRYGRQWIERFCH